MKNVGFNQEWMKTVSREEFIDHEKHNGTPEELGAYYDSVIAPKEKAKAKEPAKG
ncbi:MAG: hypothetical protein JWR05_3481 [Mucilaginibacter sp.]|nr:hypothetical protein [Mucilaginibacter sp.]